MVMVLVVCALARQAKSIATPILKVNDLISPPSGCVFARITEAMRRVPDPHVS
jgi:hypothetical protein